MPVVLHSDNATDDEDMEEDDQYTSHFDDESMIDHNRSHYLDDISSE